MKKKFNSFKNYFMFAIGFLFLFNQLVATQNNDTEGRVEELNLRLKLSKEQITNVREILREAELRRVNDRQTFKGDALALIQAAWERRRDVDSKIEQILDPQQLESYRELLRKEMHPVDRELFELTEGLFLSEDQQFDVEGVLIRWHNEYGQMDPMMEGLGDDRGRPDGPPKGGGGIGVNVGGSGGTGGMPMGMARGSGGMMKSILARKDKAIKKILNQEQKELYKQIQTDRRKQMKKWNKKMK